MKVLLDVEATLLHKVHGAPLNSLCLPYDPRVIGFSPREREYLVTVRPHISSFELRTFYGSREGYPMDLGLKRLFSAKRTPNGLRAIGFSSALRISHSIRAKRIFLCLEETL